jgi:uncharacterized protein
MEERTAVMDRTAENVDLLRSAFAAFGRGDLATLAELFDPNAIWHVLRTGQLGGDHAGWSAIAEFFAHTATLTAGTFRAEVLEVLANENGAAAVCRATGSRPDGRAFDSRQILHFHITDGTVREVWHFVDDAVAAVDFWA